MSLLDPWRRELRGLIPRGFLRLDRGEGLFLSDAPRQESAWRPAAEKMKEKGYTAELTDSGLLRIGVTAGKLRALWETLDTETNATHRGEPLRDLALRLDARKEPLEEQPRAILYRIMKDLDRKEFARLDDWLRPCLAERQRLHLPLPAAGGRMILWALKEGAEDGC